MKKKHGLAFGFAVLLTAIFTLTLTACGGEDDPDPQKYTVTFNSDGGSEVPSQIVTSGENIQLAAYRSEKSACLFKGWYVSTDSSQTIVTSITVTSDIMLKAKWESLVDYVGVWVDGPTSTYLLKPDGTGWDFYIDYNDHSNNAYEFPWDTTSMSNNKKIFLSEDKATLSVTFNGYTGDYTKQTETKSPSSTVDSSLVGTWLRIDEENSSVKLSLEIKANGDVVATNYNSKETFGCAVESSGTLYLLEKDTKLVLTAIPVTLDGRLGGGFLKQETDDNLLGIWEIGDGDTKVAYEFQPDDKGFFYMFGAKSAFTYQTVDNKLIIDNKYYEYSLSKDTLSINNGENFQYTQTATPPSGSGAGGDSRLIGTWKTSRDNISLVVTLSAGGIMTVKQTGNGSEYSSSSIWKTDTDNTKIIQYEPDISQSSGFSSYETPYTISGSTLTVVTGDKADETIRFTKQ
jgi:hypothetical protein